MAHEILKYKFKTKSEVCPKDKKRHVFNTVQNVGVCIVRKIDEIFRGE